MKRTCPHCGTSHTPSSDPQSDFCCHACDILFHATDFKTRLVLADSGKSSSFSHLKDSKLIETYLDPKSSATESIYYFYIEGLQCSSCVHLLEQLPQFYSGCQSAELNFGDAQLKVVLNPSGKLSEIADVISSMGYQPTPMKVGDLSDELAAIEKKSDLKRIAVAGVCAAQIMAFSFGLYFGADGWIRDFFRWSCLLLFVPILFYSAVPFYKGAWTSLKFRKIHIDLPIVVALWSTTLFSLWHFYQDSDLFYFDSTAGFLFLILLARYFIKRTQAHYLSPRHVQKHFTSGVYQLLNGSFKLAEQIEVDDVIDLKTGQFVPADAVLETPASLFDTSLMNGESRPNYFAEKLPLLAGYKLISDHAKIRATKTLKQSEISNLVRSSYQNLVQKNSFVSQSDRLAQKLLVTVFAAGAIGLIVLTPFIGIESSIQRVLALLVVACPCALAFGSPLTLAMAFGKAQKLGISIRNPNIFEKLNRVQNVFFDKTGTLTKGELSMNQTWPEKIDSETKRLVLEMEKISLHPVAFAVRSAWENQRSQFQSGETKSSEIIFKRHVERLGSGIVAEHQGSTFEIKALSESSHESQMAVGLFKDHEPVARLYFEDPIRSESTDIIKKLQNKNLNLMILSGDRRNRTLNIAKICGIAPDHVFTDLYPEDKEEILSRYPNSLMIGDGLNDTLALSKSDVGISMSTSQELTVGSSDVTFLRGGLNPLLDLFRLQEVTMKTLDRNLKLALYYNGISGALALAGFVNPLVAAILMPLSTGLVVLSCLWGFS